MPAQVFMVEVGNYVDQQKPRVGTLFTTDSYAVVTAAGYLNSVTQRQFEGGEFLRANYGTNSASAAIFTVSVSAGVYTLAPLSNPGEVSLIGTAVSGNIPKFSGTTGDIADSLASPSDATKTKFVMAGSAVQIGFMAKFVDTAGTVDDTAGTAINHGIIQSGLVAGGTAGQFVAYAPTTANGFLSLLAINAGGAFNTIISNSAMGQSSTISIPDPGAATALFLLSALTGAGVQHITSGGLQVDGGSFLAGLAAGGTAGSVTLYPATTANGFFKLLAVNAGGAFNTTVSNGVMGQSSVITIPDPGAATANFLLDAGAANLLAKQQVIGINEILIASVGTWTRTRIAQGNYVLRHTAADDTSVIGIDITEAIRTASSKGLRIDSIDVVYSIGTLALDAHTLTLDKIAYANNVAVSVTSVALTGSLSVATQAQPYATNIAVTTPAFDNTADSKYVLELTVDAAATSDYDFYGLVLKFSETVG
jgi:hypothetical protein